ncbi:MAG TPA: TIGR02266 family protein [Polyangiaceae bacterium]|nr:TIGR02266 family protein [Polyangiaceae bacterium]
MTDAPADHGTPSERRRSKRVPVEVALGVHSDSNFFSGLTRDISDGGLFVATHTPLPLGTHVSVKFALPACPEMEAHGVVVWLSEPNTGHPGMGVQFVQLSKENEALIRHFMAKRDPLYHDLDD